MFSLIQKILKRALSLGGLFNRLDRLEEKISDLETIVDENESLWQFLEEQKEMEKVFVGTTEELEKEFSDMMVRNMKPRGDA